MPITQIDIDDATNLIDELFGDPEQAQAYSENPEAWLGEHGYDGVNPEAVAQCGAGYGGGAAAATGGGAAASGVSGVVAALDPVVYNHYSEVDNSIDNSITNNIINNGNLDFNQQVGDGNVNVNVGDGAVVDDIQTQTGSGIQAGDDVNISDSNVATGDDNQQAIDESTNVGGDLDQSTDVDIDSHDVTGIGNVGVDASTDTDIDI